jgi:hypothetical protein
MVLPRGGKHAGLSACGKKQKPLDKPLDNALTIERSLYTLFPEIEVKTYKRSPVELIKGIVIALVTGVAASIIIGIFTPSPLFGLGVPALLSIALLYIAIFSEDVFFELEPDGLFRSYKRRILQHTFDLKNCYIAYRRKSEGGFPPTHDITLTILDTAGEGEEVSLDCGSLGLNQFTEMWREMENFALKNREVLSAKADSASS